MTIKKQVYLSPQQFKPLLLGIAGYLGSVIAADPSTAAYAGLQGVAGKTLVTSVPSWPNPTSQGTAPVPKPTVSHKAPAGLVA